MKIIIGKTSGFCYGVKRAVEGSIEEIKKQKDPIYCLGELVHNNEVIKDLEKQGLKFIENIEEVKDNKARVIVRSHGIEKEIYQKAKEKGIELVDYTCPNVLKIHKIVEEYQKKGYYIFLVGVKDHPETIGTISYSGENMSLIVQEDDIESAIKNLEKSEIKNLLVLVQTTYSIHKFEKIVEIIKSQLKEDIQMVIKNTICLTSEQRQKETEEISEQVDSMIIIGGKHSSNTRKLYEVAQKNCPNTVLIETKDELTKEMINRSERIGIMAGASTPQKSIEEIVEFLKS